MTQNFTFQPARGSNNANEANIFIHGYSAGHTPAAREKLIAKIPSTLDRYTNIFAFWPSGHFSQFNWNSLGKVATATVSGVPIVAVGALGTDRRKHFSASRSRAEKMGHILPLQLEEYLRIHYPKIDTVNFIGHSLGGRLVVSSLQTIATTPFRRICINDVLLMAAAVDVKSTNGKEMLGLLSGRLINAYSKGDWTLLMNMGENCLGRHEAEHFENIELDKFGHSDYWEKLPKVFERAQFKLPKEILTPKIDDPNILIQNQLSNPPLNDLQLNNFILNLNLNTPADIYLRINEKIADILRALADTSTDTTLNQAQKEACEQLTRSQSELQQQLSELEECAEWNTFTIAFYGETGAGKSTIIETLRILLQEPRKVASQMKFRELQNHYNLEQENAQQFEQTSLLASAKLTALERELRALSVHHEQLFCDAMKIIDLEDGRLDKLTQQLKSTFHDHEQQHGINVDAIVRLQTSIADYKENSSIWQKLLDLLRKTPQEIELVRAKQQLPDVATSRDTAGMALSTKQHEVEQNKLANEQQLSKLEAARNSASMSLLAQQAAAKENLFALSQQKQQLKQSLAQLLTTLAQHADGEIIGDGRPDFTRQTQRYDLVLNGHSFALLDVPGIEGSEGLVHEQIAQAARTAHAVFYVTNQAAPPQTGDGERKGTLEKIKAHLGSQTEVWTIFNKKITNPKFALTGRTLTSEDENRSLHELDIKMREQLGEHYREVFSLTALSAFLASTDCFAPNSSNANNRTKMINTYSPDELLEKSRLPAFLAFLSSQLLIGSKDKINGANFHKASEAIRLVSSKIEQLNLNFSKLSEQLNLEGQSAKVQLTGAFGALKTRIAAAGVRQIDNVSTEVRNAMYQRIDADISNDTFKVAFIDRIDGSIERLSKQLPGAIAKDFVYFQQDTEDILTRFEAHAGELKATYNKLASAKLDGKFKLNLNLDNGIKVTNLLATLAGIALLASNPGGWLLLALGVSGLVLGAYKSVKSFISSDFKKAQQREAVEENLQIINKQLSSALRDNLKKPLSEMQETIDQLELAVEAPAKQTAALVQLLNQSVNQLKLLSRQISNLQSVK